jgi:hypothetical protein
MFDQNRKNQQFFREKTIINGTSHEILSATLKNDPTISRIQFNDSE